MVTNRSFSLELQRSAWKSKLSVNASNNITGRDILPHWFKEDMNYTIIWLTALPSLLLEKILCLWRVHYSMPHQTRAKTPRLRGRKVWEEGRSAPQTLPILPLWRQKEESETVLSKCVTRAFHSSRGNMEKWPLGNHLQTELSHCLWNCLKIDMIK